MCISGTLPIAMSAVSFSKFARLGTCGDGANSTGSGLGRSIKILARFVGISSGSTFTAACCHHPPLSASVVSNGGKVGYRVKFNGSHSSATSFSFSQQASLHRLYTRGSTRSMAYRVLFAS